MSKLHKAVVFNFQRAMDARIYGKIAWTEKKY